MGKIDHLTSEALAEVLKGGPLYSAQAIHVQHCGDCRRTLAASLMSSRLVRPGRPQGVGKHVDSRLIERVHAAAYEFEELGSGGLSEFLATLRHLNECDPCFARFFALHQELTPTPQAIKGAIAHFASGQSVRVGTLLVTRTLEKLRQTFLPARPIEQLAVPMRDYPVAAPMRQASEFASSSGDLLSQAEGSARRLANLMRDEATELARFRKAISGSVHFADRAQPFRDLAHSFQGLAHWLAEHAEMAEALKASMSALSAEADRIAVLEDRRRTEVHVAEPEHLSLPGLSVEITAKWSGESGALTIAVRDSDTDAPRSGVEVTPLSAGYAPQANSAVTDGTGHAQIALYAGTTGLRILVDPATKPWVIGVQVREEHPLR
jgi:hypothetical protein